MRVAELVVRCLENEGVRHVFGIPGEETLALGLALEDSEQIRSVVVRHEQGAAFMADVYGRLSSYPGVCIATLGPGATNLLTGVADANLDRAPLVAITGQAGLERIHIEANQQRRFQRSGGVEFGNPDLVGLARAFGLPGYAVASADELLPTLRRALDGPGPSLVAVPIDPGENRKLGDDLYGQR